MVWFSSLALLTGTLTGPGTKVLALSSVCPWEERVVDQWGAKADSHQLLRAHCAHL